MERIEKYESPITPDEEEEEEESDEDEQERFSPEENEDHGNNDDDGDDEEEEENIKSENDDATIDQTSNKETTDKAERLWYGRAMRSQLVDPRKLPISVVLSYCLGDLDWLIDYLSDFEFQSFTVVSKCGVPPNVEHLPEGAEVIQMSNVGRIDHTIAHWMAEVLPATKHFANTKKEEIIIFMKDNVMIHTTVTLRSMETMLNIASADGFACALEPIRRKSFFHMTDALGNFYMDDYTGVIGRKNRPEGNPNDRKVVFKSQYQNMAGWLHDMGILQPRPLVPVCYGGIFAVTKSQISQVPQEIWRNLERSLSRGDNIEEGHFAERTWAGLLYPQVSMEEMNLLIALSDHVSDLWMMGTLVRH